MTARTLTPEEHQALENYAATHGRTWKQLLRDAWMGASEPGILQALRNDRGFGPRGLNAYRTLASHRAADPHCTCNDCIAWLAASTDPRR